MTVLAANARTASVVVVDSPSPEVECLVQPTEPIEYPPGLDQLKHRGLFRVRLTFTRPDAAPEAEIFYSNSDEPFRSLVLQRVYRYRIPCLKERAVLTQEFEFSHDARLGTKVAAARDGERVVDWSCLRGAERPPSYPMLSELGGEVGNILARLTFVAPDRPPRVEIVADGFRPRLASVVSDYASGYRLPCLDKAGGPLVVFQTFSFQLHGADRALLRDMKLTTLLAAAGGIEKEKVRFDLTTMGCPFDLRFTSYRPYFPNSISEVGRVDPNRVEFIAWLKTLQLKLSEKQLRQVLGDTAIVSVPCGVVDLR